MSLKLVQCRTCGRVVGIAPLTLDVAVPHHDLTGDDCSDDGPSLIRAVEHDFALVTGTEFEVFDDEDPELPDLDTWTAECRR